MSGINGEEPAEAAQWSVQCGGGRGLGWVQSNPFKDLTKRVKAKTKVKEVVLLDHADQTWQKLPRYHHLLWHILRWSGAHASEVGGLRWEDIDLQEEVIHFRSHETRPLKNAFRRRTVPIQADSFQSSGKNISTRSLRD